MNLFNWDPHHRICIVPKRLWLISCWITGRHTHREPPGFSRNQPIRRTNAIAIKIALRYAIRFPWATKPKDSSPNGLVQLRLCCGVDIKLWELHGNPNQNNPSNFTLSKFRIAVSNPVASSMSNNTGSLSWSKPCLSTCNFKGTNIT